MHDYLAIIKRPLLERNEVQLTGYSAQDYSEILNH